jgi:hypothetical protein
VSVGVGVRRLLVGGGGIGVLLLHLLRFTDNIVFKT